MPSESFRFLKGCVASVVVLACAPTERLWPVPTTPFQSQPVTGLLVSACMAPSGATPPGSLETGPRPADVPSRAQPRKTRALAANGARTRHMVPPQLAQTAEPA